MTRELSGPIGTVTADARASEPEVRWRTAALLAEIPGEETEALLVGLLKDPDYRVRERAAKALVGRLTERVGDACLAALADESDAGHRAAAVGLLIGAGPAGSPYLVKALQSASVDVRLAGAMSLPASGSGSEAVRDLAAALEQEKDTNVGAALLLALGRTKRREAVASILPYVDRASSWLRVHAVEALGEIGDPDTSGFLLSRTGDPALRRSALRSLARLRTARPADELARMAFQERLDPDLLRALRCSVEAGSQETVEVVKRLWPGAFDALAEVMRSRDTAPPARSDAAHLAVLLDLDGACLEILRAGPYADGYACLGRLGRGRIGEAVPAVLQTEDPEVALVLVERAVELGEEALLAPLLVHSSASVRAAVLNSLPPGLVRLSDLLDVLAEDDPETALPAALAVASAEAGAAPDRLEAAKRALLDRADGPDGPGRIAALLALAELEGKAVEQALAQALGSPEATTRVAALRAAARRLDFPGAVVGACLEDPDPSVRAAALRSISRWAEGGRSDLPVDWRDCLVYLADEGPVPAAAGAAIVALAGPERPRMAEELLAQGDAIRLSALEEIARTGDADAAERVALAALHEDEETARAALVAQIVARPEAAAAVAAAALGDARPTVRRAAAELVQRRGEELRSDRVAAALSRALASEADAGTLEALLEAVPAAGDETAAAALTPLLAREEAPAGAGAAAEALAARYEEAVRSEWRTAPARAEQRWAHALSAVGRGADAPISGRRP